MPGRHFHFALEFTDGALSDVVMRGVVTSVLRHAGLSAVNAAEVTPHVVAAAHAGPPGPCRVAFDGGVDEVEILVAHGGATTWRGVRAVE